MDTSEPAAGLPAVSVVMPLRDDARHLRAAVEAVLAQDYDGSLEVVLAVAPSSDDTEEVARDLAASDDRVRVVPNPGLRTSAGLNAGIAAAKGEIIARVDGHAVIEPGYLRRAVELLAETGADNVGGVQAAEGQTPFERAVAAAMSSPFGVGDARFHYGGAPGPTDTVYLGVFRREALERVGGFDETLVRNQDYELNWRLRESGGTVYFHPDLRVRYRPRSTLRALALQYFEYGRWKRVVLRRHPGSLRARQLAPPAVVIATATGAILALWHPAWFVVPAGYIGAALAATVIEGRRQQLALPVLMRVPPVFAAMHFSWGCGFLMGPLRSTERGRRP